MIHRGSKRPLLVILTLILIVCISSINALGFQTKNIIVVVLDGVRNSEAFGDPNHTNIPYIWNELRPLGSMCTNFMNLGYTETIPGHCSIATGTLQGITNDGRQRPTMPTMFEYYRKALNKPMESVLTVMAKDKLEVTSYSAHPDYGKAFAATSDCKTRSDKQAFDALILRLQNNHPSLVMLNLSGPDNYGHNGNWDRYLNSIKTCDEYVYKLWQFIQSDPFYSGTTTLIITGDHGRHTNDFSSHGDKCVGCKHLTFLAIGPDIKIGYTSETSYSQIDILPTIGLLLDFPTPLAKGKFMTDILINPSN